MTEPSTAPFVSDTERDQAVAQLRAGYAEGRLTVHDLEERLAGAYQARTAADLVPVLAGLPVERPASRPRRWVVAVCSGARLGGRWRPARPMRAVAVLGSCRVDLSDADLHDGDVALTAVAVLGGIEVLVPEGMGAELGGVAVFGSKDYRVRDQLRRTELPVARVRAIAVLGGVTVRTRPFTNRAHGRSGAD